MKLLQLFVCTLALSAGAVFVSDAQSVDYPPLLFRDEGIDQGRATKAINCTGAGINCSASAGVVTVDMTDSFDAPVIVTGSTSDTDTTLLVVRDSNLNPVFEVWDGGQALIGGAGSPNSQTLLDLDNNATGKRFDSPTGLMLGVQSIPVAALTSGPKSTSFVGLWGSPEVGVDTTQNFTNSLVGVVGVVGTTRIKPTSGTTTHAAGFAAINDTNTGGTVTNYYGLLVQSLTRGTNNYAIYNAGASAPIVNFSAYQARSANQGRANWATAETLVTCSSGATCTATSLIPAGSVVSGVTIRVTTAITGAITIDIGDGTDVDRWGAGIGIAANTTTSGSDFTITSVPIYAAATNVVLTANGANFTGGVVRITVHYMDFTPAQS